MEILQASEEEDQSFSLILLDSQMPGVDGFVVAEFIQNHPQMSSAAVVMLTTAGQRSDANPNLRVSAYVTKPACEADLLNALVQKREVIPPRKTNPVKPAPLEQPARTADLLLAEDNAVNQMLAIRLLERLGYKVTLAENGLQAVAAHEKKRFDLILMDVQMPEMGGFEATAIIRKRERLLGRHTPIIALTAHALQGDRDKCIEAGMDDYLSKPIRSEQLKVMIEKYLNMVPNGSTPEPSASSSTSTTVTQNQPLLYSTDTADRALLAEIATVFLSEYPVLMSAINASIMSGDFEKLYRAAHSLKGAVSNFSNDAMKTCFELQMIGKLNGDLAAASEHYSQLTNEINALLPIIQNLDANDNKRTPDSLNKRFSVIG